MKYVKYFVLLLILFTLNCSLKEPVETDRKEFEINPGEKKLLKSRTFPQELFLVNNSASSITGYIEATGPVWDESYDTTESYHYSSQTIPADSLIYHGWDHVAVGKNTTPYFAYAVYKVGVSGVAYTRISYIDDRYYNESSTYGSNFDMIVYYDGSNLTMNTNQGEDPWGVDEDDVFFIWDKLAGEGSTSVGEFADYGLNKISGLSISGSDSLPSQQSGNFTANRTSLGSRDAVYLEYKWWLKTADGSYVHQSGWDNDSTVSHSSEQSFTLKCEI